MVSKTDPQILIWQGSSFTINDGFCIKVAQNVSEVGLEQLDSGGSDPNKDSATNFISKVLAFVPATEPGVAVTADIELTMGEWLPMAQAVNNRKWKPAAGGAKLGKITIDVRNNMIRFD